MQSNYFVPQCEFKNVQVSWSVIREFTVEAGSQPPNMLLPVDSGAQLLLSDQWECKWGCLLCGCNKCGEWGPSRGLAVVPYVSLQYAGKVWLCVCFRYFISVYDAFISAPSPLVEFLHLTVFVSILCLQDSRDKMLMTEVLPVQYTVHSVSEAKSCFIGLVFAFWSGILLWSRVIVPIFVCMYVYQRFHVEYEGIHPTRLFVRACVLPPRSPLLCWRLTIPPRVQRRSSLFRCALRLLVTDDDEKQPRKKAEKQMRS